MGKDGFTLVELIIVMAVIAILLAIGTLSFNQMSRKASMEAQIRVLHADILNIRAQSIYQRKGRSIKILANEFLAYPSNDTTVTPVLKNSFKFPVNAVGQVDFDERGIASGNKFICISGENPAVLDAIVITSTQIRMGKRKSGEGCSDGHIIIK